MPTVMPEQEAPVAPRRVLVAAPEVIHRAIRGAPAGYASKARCGNARFEGGYTEPMRVTHDRREVTCWECSLAPSGMAWRMLAVYALVAGLFVLDGFGNVLARLRGRRAAPVYGRPGSAR